MSSSRPSGLGMTFLLGGILILLALSLVLAFVPIAKCPDCPERPLRGNEKGDNR